MIQASSVVTTNALLVAGFMVTGVHYVAMPNTLNSRVSTPDSIVVLRMLYGPGNSEGALAQISGEFSNRSARVIGLLENMRGGGKRVNPKLLAAAIPKSSSNVKMPALAAPDEDEWEEF